MNNCVPSHFSHVQLFATLWIVTWQTPLSMGFSRQEYWGGLQFPPPEDLPDPCLLCLLHWQAGSLPLAPPGQLYANKLDNLDKMNKLLERHNLLYWTE